MKWPVDRCNCKPGSRESMGKQYLPGAPLMAASTVTKQDQRTSGSNRGYLPEDTHKAALTTVDLER
jgi:hypothetical protein